MYYSALNTHLYSGRLVRFGALPLFAGPKSRWYSFLFYYYGKREKNQKEAGV